jgi:hypothetical protein
MLSVLFCTARFIWYSNLSAKKTEMNAEISANRNMLKAFNFNLNPIMPLMGYR